MKKQLYFRTAFFFFVLFSCSWIIWTITEPSRKVKLQEGSKQQIVACPHCSHVYELVTKSTKIFTANSTVNNKPSLAQVNTHQKTPVNSLKVNAMQKTPMNSANVISLKRTPMNPVNVNSLQRELYKPKPTSSTAKPQYAEPSPNYINIMHKTSEKWFSQPNMCSTASKFIKSSIRVRSWAIPIYIHAPQKDIVSGTLFRSNVWERSNIETILKLLGRFPQSTFLDIGSNMGVFTLVAAKMGRSVLAVEPSKSNIERLCASLHASGLYKMVTIVTNALSDVIQNVTMAHGKNNVGDSFVVERNLRNFLNVNKQAVKSNDVIETAKMDDLLDLPNVNISDIVIKIDVEGYEARVLQGGKNFFDQVSVRGVMMEWMFHKFAPTKQVIINFFISRGFKPYNPFTLDLELNIQQAANWPTDILWLKK